MPIVYNVRPATQDDFELLLELNKALFDYEYDYGFTQTHNLDWTYSDAGRAVFTSYLEKPNAGAWIATNEQGEPVGYLAAIVEDKPSRSVNPVAEIENMYVNEGYRCSGVGRTLVEDFKTWCEKQGAQLIRVGAFVDNKHARDFYEKWGFQEAEVIYEMPVGQS